MIFLYKYYKTLNIYLKKNINYATIKLISIERSGYMNRNELKMMAKNQIKGKIGILFLITIIISLISGAIIALVNLIHPSLAPAVATIIVTPAFTLSLAKVYLMVCKGKTPEIKDTFSGFEDFFSAFKVTFLVGLFTFLWSLLFVVPGIIKSMSYSMSIFVLAENKGKPALECINESKKMTRGHKGELFVLYLSFIGWIILGSLTFGILYIWLIPYVQATFVNAYNKLKPIQEFDEQQVNYDEVKIPVAVEIPQPIENSDEKIEEKISPAKEEIQSEESLEIKEEIKEEEFSIDEKISPAEDE